jgi:hypothetical protein
MTFAEMLDQAIAMSQRQGRVTYDASGGAYGTTGDSGQHPADRSNPAPGRRFDAGVGKSRLLYEFVPAHRTQGWPVLEAASVSYGKATPISRRGATPRALRRRFAPGRDSAAPGCLPTHHRMATWGRRQQLIVLF